MNGLPGADACISMLNYYLNKEREIKTLITKINTRIR